MVKRSLLLSLILLILIYPIITVAEVQKVSLNNKDVELSKEPKYIYKRNSPFERSLNTYERRDSKFEIGNGNWGQIMKSYLINNENGTFSVVDAYSEDNITMITYDLYFNILSTKKIKKELEKFGAFYKGEDGYYILFGQDNREENNNKEVYRIVKYSFDFDRIGVASVKGGESYTTEPFSAGTTRMAQKGNSLIIHTSRTRYLTEDGLNHQSNMTIKINTDKMKVTYISNQFPKNHVSHSFNQFVLFDKDTPVYVDHSDSYPSRAIVLTKESLKEYYDRVNLMYFYGEDGDNCTGVSLGGFGISNDNYIVAGNSIMQNENYLSNEIRNIFIATTPREDAANHNTELIWFTYHSESGHKNVFEPKLVKIDDKSFILLWQECNTEELLWWNDYYKNNSVKYVFLDATGHPMSDVKIIEQGILPNCEPIIVENNLIWHAIDSEDIYFYKIPIEIINSKQELNPSADEMNIKKGNKIIAGTLYAMVLKEDGTIWGAGDNEYGQLGNGTNKNSNIPVKVKGLDKVVQVSAGEYDVTALKSDGTVWTWGRNKSNSPIQIKGLDKIVEVSTGSRHTLALKEDGTVWSWGENIFGQLGDRTNKNSNIPIQAKGVDNVKKAVAGNSYTMVLKNDGTVWAWGANYSGELGDGTNIDKDLLVKVKGLENIIDISAGDMHNMALKEDGTVWTWGSNILGLLGNGTVTDSNIPLQVKGLNKVIAISASSGQSAALDESGNVWTWGLSTGRHREDSLKPMMVKELGKVTAISAGWNFTMVIKEDSSIWAWGNNYRGQFGIGNNETPFNPVKAFTKLKDSI